MYHFDQRLREQDQICRERDHFLLERNQLRQIIDNAVIVDPVVVTDNFAANKDEEVTQGELPAMVTCWKTMAVNVAPNAGDGMQLVRSWWLSLSLPWWWLNQSLLQSRQLQSQLQLPYSQMQIRTCSCADIRRRRRISICTVFASYKYST